MSNFAKPSVLIPILVGAIVGTMLFILGGADDAPGLSLVGLVVALLLVMWGIYNTGMIKKWFLTPILLLSFGMGGILLTIVLLLDSEFDESPGVAMIGVVLGVALIVIGTIRLRKMKERD